MQSQGFPEGENGGIVEKQKQKHGSGMLAKLTETPFEMAGDIPNRDKTSSVDTLVVKRTKGSWSNLLLDIAMTTTFANLTDTVDVLAALDIPSYVVFFAMLWWIWASQVAYNVRFRTSDWVHRVCVVVQLLVFCTLAAFTNDFDIVKGIRKDDDDARLRQLQRDDFFSDSDIGVLEFRANLLDRLNGRGISITMATSRLILMMQYLLVLFYAKGKESILHQQSLLVHIGSLATSAIIYFVAYVSIQPGPGHNIMKIILWCAPIVIEAALHLFANRRDGRVRYPAPEIYERSATVFIIVLGGGLDKITKGFRYFAGSFNLGARRIGIIFSAAIIFVSQFILYFTTHKPSNLKSSRLLSWFFAHLFHLAVVMLTLEGLSALLESDDINNAIKVPVGMIDQILSATTGDPIISIRVEDLQHLVEPLSRIEISLETLVADLNTHLENLPLYMGVLYQWSVFGIRNVLKHLDHLPEEGTLLELQMHTFLEANATNTTTLTESAYRDIVVEVIHMHGQSAEWFFSVAGFTLITSALLRVISMWPSLTRGAPVKESGEPLTAEERKFEWFAIGLRLVLGVAVVLLLLLNLGTSHVAFDGDDPTVLHGSPIWVLSQHLMIMPLFAILLVLELCAELLAAWYWLYWTRQRSGGVGKV